MKSIIITTAIALTAITVTPAAAQSWGQQRAQPQPGTIECQQQVNNNRLVGGLLGAAVGAAAGRSAASRGNRSEGGALGAVAGAVVGSEIGRRNPACNDPRFDPNRNRDAYDYRGAPQPVYNQGYQGGYQAPHQGGGYYQTGNGGYNGGYSRQPQPNCGWGETRMRQPNGRVATQQVWMCEAADGNWYPAQ